MIETLRSAVRDGPDAMGPSEYGKRTVAALIWWQTIAGVVMFYAFLWAVGPYIASPPGGAEALNSARFVSGIVPWLLVRPLRLIAALPLTLWILDRLTTMPRY